jgi:hypothetical protein
MKNEKTWKPSKTDSMIYTWRQAEKNFKTTAPLVEDEIFAIFRGEKREKETIELLEDIIEGLQKTIDKIKN